MVYGLKGEGSAHTSFFLVARVSLQTSVGDVVTSFVVFKPRRSRSWDGGSRARGVAEHLAAGMALRPCVDVVHFTGDHRELPPVGARRRNLAPHDV